MFVHNFKYALKILFKNKMLIFWTFAFPIILGSFFSLAFSDIENSEKLDIIDIAIVETEELSSHEIFKESFKTLSDEENKDRLFNTKYVSLSDAEDLLSSDAITGYLLFEDNPKVVINSNGINETIFKYVVEEISQTENMVNTLMEEKLHQKLEESTGKVNYEALSKEIINEVNNIIQNSEANIENISNNNLSYTMIEYYTLIAMACLYGAILGVVLINYSLPNMSSNGKRVAVSPTSKASIVVSNLLASYITQVIGVALLFLYTIFVLNVDYGNNLPLIILLALVGCLAGLSLGITVSTLFKSNENVKTGVVIAITMFGCFLSGMMGITMKYVIDKNVPIVNKINPANMITDGLYSLYYYDTLNRYWFNVISLLIFAFILIGISMFSLRRQKYDSI